MYILEKLVSQKLRRQLQMEIDKKSKSFYNSYVTLIQFRNQLLFLYRIKGCGFKPHRKYRELQQLFVSKRESNPHRHAVSQADLRSASTSPLRPFLYWIPLSILLRSLYLQNNSITTYIYHHAPLSPPRVCFLNVKAFQKRTARFYLP